MATTGIFTGPDERRNAARRRRSPRGASGARRPAVRIGARRRKVASALAVLAAISAVTAGGACGRDTGRPRVRAADVYVSLGDSYAMGYQPVPDRAPGIYRHGFAYLLAARARQRGYRLTLLNLGCGGATVATMTSTPGCVESSRSPGGPTYTDSQLDHAIGYLRRHPGRVRVITVVIGLNDTGPCWASPRFMPCMRRTMRSTGDALKRALARLRDAAGPRTSIVGLSYPAVELGRWLRGTPEARERARRSVAAFRDIVNPELAEAYRTVGATFVDVTRATGAYVPLDRTTTLAPYGRLPVAVARACELTWYCAKADVHLRDGGHELVAALIVGALPPARG